MPGYDHQPWSDFDRGQAHVGAILDNWKIIINVGLMPIQGTTQKWGNDSMQSIKED